MSFLVEFSEVSVSPSTYSISAGLVSPAWRETERVSMDNPQTTPYLVILIPTGISFLDSLLVTPCILPITALVPRASVACFAVNLAKRFTGEVFTGFGAEVVGHIIFLSLCFFRSGFFEELLFRPFGLISRDTHLGTELVPT